MSVVREVDVAIVGAGTAGLNAYRGARSVGASALLLDPGPLGTTCARIGCMPSKVLIAAAHHAHSAREAGDFGVAVGPVEVDREGVMSRVQRLRDHFVTKTRRGIDAIAARGDLIDARATLVGDGTLALDDGTRVQAKAVVLAAGSRPFVPAPYTDLGDRLLTNEQVFELERLPQHGLLVVGAGPVGLELGQAMHRLGVRTTILDIDGRIGGLEDPVAAESLRSHLANELDLHVRHQLLDVRREGDDALVRFVDDRGVERTERYEYVLSAAGRRPRLRGLGLEALGLDPDSLSAIDPETGRIGDTSLFLAGDATGSRMLLHEAAHEGRVAGVNAARFPEVVQHARKAPLAIVFTDPQVAVAGAGLSQLDASTTVVAEFDMGGQSRAKVEGNNHGVLRLYADRDTGLLRGGTLVGPAAEHLGHLLAWAIQRELTAEDVLELPFYHPVVEEGLQAVLRKVQVSTDRSLPPRR